MKMSEQINELAAALAKAQGEMRFAAKANVNPHFKSKYADMASVIEAIREPLARNGLAHTQLCREGEGGTVIVDTVLMHLSGQYIASSMTMRPVKNDPQGIGSALTYARRYALQGICGLASDDDDGNAASASSAPPSQYVERAPQRNVDADIAQYTERVKAAKTNEELLAAGRDCRAVWAKGTPQFSAFMLVYNEHKDRVKGE